MDVASKKRIPIRTPQHLDDVPPGARKKRLQFLDDLSIASHGAIETLQIAVDDKSEIVQTLPRGERERANRFRLIHFAVAEDTPYMTLPHRRNATMFEVAHEACLIDGADWPNAHGAGWKLPEVGHEPGMRIRAQPAAANLLPVVAKLLLGKPPFQIRSGIDAWRRVRLEEHEIAIPIVMRSAKKMVEADFEDFS